MNTAIVSCHDFQRLITSVMRFPSIGSFGGSELINLQAQKGKLTASSFGVVLAKASVPVTGELELVAVNELLLKEYSQICGNRGNITLTSDGKVITLDCPRKEAQSSWKQGIVHSINVGEPTMKMDARTAKRINYLSNTAYSDASKPELCCVMLVGDKRAMSCNQKAAAMLRVEQDGQKPLAIPLPLAKMIRAGDIVYAGERETTVRSGIARYQMPAPVKAQKGFPVATLNRFGEIIGRRVVTCRGSVLTNSISQCSKILLAMSKTEVVLSFILNEGRLVMSGENGGVKFKRDLKVVKGSNYTEPVRVPLEDLAQAVSLFEHEQDVKILVGKIRGETVLRFEHGWVVFGKYKK